LRDAGENAANDDEKSCLCVVLDEEQIPGTLEIFMVNDAFEFLIHSSHTTNTRAPTVPLRVGKRIITTTDAVGPHASARAGTDGDYGWRLLVEGAALRPLRAAGLEISASPRPEA
jgi:hypothetical protein